MQAEFITDAALKNFQPGLSEGDHLPALLCSEKNDLLFSTVVFCEILWHSPGCPNLSQNYFTEKLNTAPEVKGV